MRKRGFMTEKDVLELLGMTEPPRPASFRMVRDPATGRRDMEPVVEAEWGTHGDSAELETQIGTERYRRFRPEGFDGRIGDDADLHDACLMEVGTLVAPHVDGTAMTALGRDWTDLSRATLSGRVAIGTLMIGMTVDGVETAMFLTVERDQVLRTMLTADGDVLGPPIVHWNGDGAFTSAVCEAVERHMIDGEMLEESVRRTELMLAAERCQAAMPEGVVDFEAFRMRRAAAA